MASHKMKRNAAREKLNQAVLYGILDMGYVDEHRLMETAKGLLSGGVGVLQLRAKGYDAESVLDLVQRAAPDLLDLCHQWEVPLIINDFPEVAVALEADGVHIGQDDGSLVDVRAEVGEDMIVGRSTHSPSQAAAAFDEGFDYIGFGPLFPTPTKQGRPGIGLDDIAEVQKGVGEHIPVFCIGGIKTGNLELVLASGACRVVIVSALLQADDISAATHEMVTRLKR